MVLENVKEQHLVNLVIAPKFRQILRLFINGFSQFQSQRLEVCVSNKGLYLKRKPPLFRGGHYLINNLNFIDVIIRKYRAVSSVLCKYKFLFSNEIIYLCFSFLLSIKRFNIFYFFIEKIKRLHYNENKYCC